MAPFARKSNKSKRTYKKSSMRKKPLKSKALTKTIKRIISSEVETKHAFQELPNAGFNSGITQSADLCFPLPYVPQDVTEKGRIGDQIKCQSLKINGILTMNLGYSGLQAATRIAVRIMCVQPKLYTSRDVIVSEWSAWTQNLLRKGGTNTTFTGILSDLHAEINTDMITKYYDKIFYMTIPFVPSSALGVPTYEQQTQFSTKFFTINLKLRNKLLRYNTGFMGNNVPTNYCPVILCGYTHLDGSAPDTGNTQVNMQYVSNLAYEDA